MPNRFLFIALAGMLATMLAGAVRAQGLDTLPLVPGQKFEQIFFNDAPIVGSILTGARLGDADGGLDPSSIRYGLGTGARGGVLCVQISSVDGKFSAINRYAVPSNATPAPRVETQIAEPQRVAKYLAAETGVVATSDPDCFADRAKVFPARLSQKKSRDVLVLFVDADGAAVRASVMGKTTACEPATAAVYTARCTLALDGVSDGDHKVELILAKSSGGEVRRTYTVVISRAGFSG